MTATEYAYVVLDEKGRPVIAGTRFKVAMIAVDKAAWGWDADQIQRQHPHLTLGQIHSAPAYYYDNREEIDRYNAESDRLYEEMRAEAGESPLLRKLGEAGLVP